MNEHDLQQPEETDPPEWTHSDGNAPSVAEVAESDLEKSEPDGAVRARAMKELITGAQMANKSYRKEHFLIGPKLLPVGGRMLITAETGTGKSALALHIAACITTGKPLFGLLRAKKDADCGKPFFPVIKRGDVLYLDFELPEHIRWHERLSPLTTEFGVDFLKDIYFPKKPNELRLDPGEGFDKLRRLICAIKPSVTIIDPLSSTHSADENTNSLKQPLNKIDQLIEDSGTTVILIHHSSAKKARNVRGEVVEKTAKERPRGHTCLVDWADVQLHLEALNLRDRRRYEDDDEESDAAGLLGLEFGKTRYCPTPRGRRIEVRIGDMYFGRPRKDTASAGESHAPSKDHDSEGGPTSAVEATG
jgi:RecA-family ATPase